MLLGVKKVHKGEEDQVKLPDVDTGRLLGLKYKLIMPFQIGGDMVGVASGSL